MTVWTRADYDLISEPWGLWLAQSQWQPLDRWLKQLGGYHPARRHLQQVDRRPQVAAMMFSAMRFLHLAAALEQSYRDQSLPDWSAWDSDWQLNSVAKIPPAGFWYWIALRNQSAAEPPRPLRDASARREWFTRVEASLDKNTLTPAWLTWQGLRPQWLPALQERQGASQWSEAELLQFIAQQQQVPPLWLRPQRDQTHAFVAEALSKAGVRVRLESEQALCAEGGKGIAATEVYKNGLVEIQDLASQQISAAVAVQPGQKVWDACAGAGGKSLAIAARMNNKGVLVATDLHAYKLDELKRRAKRAQVFNIRTFAWNGREALRLPKEVAQQQGFDWVLVDAPCSSSGTWRRNPDARWRFSAEDTAELLELQQQILANAALAVRTGGHLVYATCSWQLCENENQVKFFLQKNSGFRLVSQAMLGAPDTDADTMFVSVLARNEI